MGLKAFLKYFGLLLMFHCFMANGQPETITIKGNVINAAGLGGLYQVIVINQRTSEGMMAEPGGEFDVTALKTDTLLVSASGYGVKKICFRDSAYRPEYHITVTLEVIQYKLPEVKVYPKKNLNEINEEKQQLGNIPNTDLNKDATLMNPISYLYERFSRIEQSKRKVAQMEDEQNRRAVLKDMLHLYIKWDIIKLSDEQFDNFIDYMNLSDYFIKYSTDYDLITTIKKKYEEFEKVQSYYEQPGTYPYTRYDR